MNSGYPILKWQVTGCSHEYEVSVTAPTCTDAGYSTYTCTACGDQYVDDHVDALEHSYTDGVCSICGEEDPNEEDPGYVNPFEDVIEDQYYYDPIKWAVQNGVTNGLSATIFGVDQDCTRAQFVTFLWRAAGSPEPAAAENPFSDVEENQFYTKAIAWAVEAGITTGLNATTFGVNAPCTREQVVTFLWRYAGKPASTAGNNPFSDVLEDQFYTDAILWAVEEGITNGLNATTFGVGTACNRAMVVTFLYRAIA